MRMLWAKANEGSVPDLELAKQACAVAAQCAPYCHPRLAAVAARVGIAAQVETISVEERRRRAREEIERAFAEYPRQPEAEARRIEQRLPIKTLMPRQKRRGMNGLPGKGAPQPQQLGAIRASWCAE